MGNVTKNFSFAEFACSCGKCSFVGGYQIDQKLVRDLQAIRDHLGKPLKINSGLRCDSYNRSLGGVSRSYHLTGRAADVHCTSSIDRHIIVKMALNMGLTVGVAKTFIHLDNRGKGIIFLY
jgi:uncharacterized protein YcbK (DUF882 family)